MTWRTLFIAVAMLGSVAVSVKGQQSPAQWPPVLTPVRTDAPILSPEDEMRTFAMPPGYRVQLVASEPIVQDAVLMEWDQDGRMWVIEMPGYMPEMNPSNDRERVPDGRIVVLEDTNNDGRMDKRTVFVDKLVLPRSLKPLDRGVLVAEPPNLWYYRDVNRDLIPESRELVTNTYGTLLASPEHNANGLMWALDNWMHTSEHDGFLRLKDSKFELARTLSRGQWGLSQDDGGRIYRNTNEAALFVDLVSERYYTRNPNMLRTRGLYDSLENRAVNTVWPAHQTPGVNRGYQTGVLKADGTLAAFTSVSAPTVYRGDRLPSDLSGNIFVVEPAANLVSRIIVTDDGASLVAKKAYEQAEFLASTDERFRPVYLSSAPDGALYVLDLYRGIIQHRNFVTEYLRDQIVSRQLEMPTSRGRIYRIVHDTTTLGPKPSLSAMSTSQLTGVLAHPNGWWRDNAQRILVERGDRSPQSKSALQALALTAPDWRTRLHALWTLDGIDATETPVLSKALADPSRDVRAAAIRLSEPWIGLADHPLQASVVAMMNDRDWAVRRQLAATLGELPAGKKEAALAEMLSRAGDDPVVMDAAISGMRGSERAVLDVLMQQTTETPQVSAAITMIAGTVVRGGQDVAVQAVFDCVSDASHVAWQRAALMRGAEVALLSAAMPGTPARAPAGPPAATPAAPVANATNPPAAAPCPTCPGARGGPGGSSAFMPPAAPGGGGGGGGRGGPMLRLAREPKIVSLTAEPDTDLGKRAVAVLARVEWPGKPGVAAPVAPLTADEQRRFEAGHQVFQNLCQACHQADGRGRDKLAPSLVGSTLALAAPHVPVRILLNGKEGSVGLMPPLGGGLTDEQIADVLTYVRREWGQTGSAVDASIVKAMRAETAARTRPWTNEELLRLIGGR